MKTIVVGDIHGRFEQFNQLLDKTQFSSDTDKLILLGDLIDRGDDSYGVIRRVIDLKNKMNDRMIIIRGSHEYLALSSNLKDKMLWKMVGKAATMRSFYRYGETFSDYLPWIEQNTVIYHEEENYQCVHAAIIHESLLKNDEYTLMMDHFTVKKNRYFGKLTLVGHIHLKYPIYFDGKERRKILLPYEEILPLPFQGVICLDTKRYLTGMIIEDDNFILLRA